MAPEITFGKYHLVAELGQGGMADVILAVARGPVGFSKLMVIKRLRQHLADDPEFVAMLMDEARLAARLNHPNIVHTNEVGEIDGRFFMAMEYLEGQPLTRIRRRAARNGSPMTLETELHIITDVLSGLHYAHELSDYDGSHLGVVHRDVTPSNIFVTYEGVVKVLDFGIAKATGRTTETRTGVIKGKMTYMSPEQAIGLDLDHRADLFSVGVMLWEACAGQRMWKGLDDVVVLSRLINGDIPTSPRAVNPDVPEELDAICQKALSPEPEERFASAQEFQNELEAAARNLGATSTQRALGRFVAELFAVEHKEIKAIIERQLSKMSDASASSLQPVMIPESISASTMGTLTDLSPSIGPSAPPEELLVATTPYGERPRRSRSLVGLGVAAAAAMLAGVWLAGRYDIEEQAPEAAASAPGIEETEESAPAASSTEEQAPTDVRITLRAEPAHARFSIDDGEWIDNPYVGRVPIDGEEHTIRIAAKGYETKTLPVAFDRDVLLDVTLTKSRVSRRYVPRPRPRPQPTPTPVPASTATSEREIFTGDPWADR